jgi:transcriptional regulator of acetoin/glycerol metabolism
LSTATATAVADDVDAEIDEDAIRPFEDEEKVLLSRALRATRGNVRRAAQLLGIGRATLYRKIQQFNLRLQ